MTGYDHRLIRQSQHLVVNGSDDLVERAPGQIGAPDAAGEKRIARNQLLLRWEVEAHASLGMAGRMHGYCVDCTTLNRILIFQTLIDFYGSRR